jgi:hypothetical protein
MTFLDLKSVVLISKLSVWRNDAQFAYSSRFTVTREGTRDWLDKGVLNNDSRLFYWIASNNFEYIGVIFKGWHTRLKANRFLSPSRKCISHTIIRKFNKSFSDKERMLKDSAPSVALPSIDWELIPTKGLKP